MGEIIFIVEEAAEGGFVAKSLDESIFTEGDTLDVLKESIREAVNCHFEDAASSPKIIRLHFVKEEVMAV